MPRNGSGVYSKPAGSDAVSNTTIESSKYNALMDDIVADMNAARPVAYGGTGATSALTFTDLSSSTSVITPFLKDQGGTVTTGGSANAQTVTLNQAIATTVPTGFFFTVKFGYTNTSTTVTLNVNSIGAKSVKVINPVSGSLVDPPVGSIVAGNYGMFVYDGTYLVLTNPTPGGQYPFPGTQNDSTDANTLDDYQEGTWTPTISFGGASVGVTYGTGNGGRYTKIGNMIFVAGRLVLASKGTSTGSALIGGLPINAVTTTPPASVAAWQNMATITSVITANISGSGAAINLWNSNATTAVALTNSNFTNTSQFDFCVTYLV